MLPVGPHLTVHVYLNMTFYTCILITYIYIAHLFTLSIEIYSSLNTKMNEWGCRPPLWKYMLNWARRTSWGWWHCPPHTGCEIRALAVWGRARYLSVTEAPHNIKSARVSGKKHFVSLKLECHSGNKPAISDFQTGTTAPGPPLYSSLYWWRYVSVVRLFREPVCSAGAI